MPPENAVKLEDLEIIDENGNSLGRVGDIHEIVMTDAYPEGSVIIQPGSSTECSFKVRITPHTFRAIKSIAYGWYAKGPVRCRLLTREKWKNLKRELGK